MSDNCISIVPKLSSYPNKEEKAKEILAWLTSRDMINGLQIIQERSVFTAMANGLDELICPNCKQDLAGGDLEIIDEWFANQNDTPTCPHCNTPADIHKFEFTPQWGFSDLGFTFWNCPDLTDSFIDDFKEKLGCEINVVYAHI